MIFGKDRGAEYPEEKRNGEWEYQVFTPDRKVNDKANLNSCFECHKPHANTELSVHSGQDQGGFQINRVSCYRGPLCHLGALGRAALTAQIMTAADHKSVANPACRFSDPQKYPPPASEPARVARTSRVPLHPWTRPRSMSKVESGRAAILPQLGRMPVRQNTHQFCFPLGVIMAQQ